MTENSKSQAPNPKSISIFKTTLLKPNNKFVLNFNYCVWGLFGIWCLVFGISFLLADDNAVLIKQGKATFEQHCARCHGPEGKGDGPDAKRVPVVPRDLTEGLFKFQSTAQGTPLGGVA